ncbi:Rapamycin-insensitive companion of mTOR, N-term-domain-containing protein [Amylocystis lapponica]|nr:Rapamycin-insensitive companion of mTOR, N-term-domain-containing protein [Amylocystis lapponica]
MPMSRPHEAQGTSAHTSSMSVTSTAVSASGLPGNGHSHGDRSSSDAFIELDGQDQLQVLNNQLKVENRIKEGAENLLQMPLTDTLRMQVESELEMAKSKIGAIMKSIETQSARGARKKSNESGNSKRKFTGPPLTQNAGTSAADDFRSAMHQANSYIKSLFVLSRPVTSSSLLAPPVPPASASPSSSTSPKPAVADEAELNRARIDTMTRLIGVLQRNLRVRYELDIAEVVNAVLPSLADRASKQCRATTYRLLRHSLVDVQSVQRLQRQNLEWYMVKSLTRDNKYAVEKEQVIKLIRAIVEIGSERRTPGSAVGSGTVPLGETVMRAFIAVAEYPEDPFKPICVQTLTEILLIDIELMARTGGIRVLLHALAEGPPEMAPMLSSAFLYIVDSPRTRAYLNPGTDLEIALSGVTDAYGKGPEYADRMRSCARVIASMLRTWSGLMYFSIQDKLALRAVVDGLRIPSLETREIIIDMFFDLMNIKPPEWHQAFIDGRRLTMYRRTKHVPNTVQPLEPPQRHQVTLKLTDQYIALLILVFSKAGLLDALTSMLEETPAGSNLSRKATLLMAELLQTANRVLPLSIAAEIQALPRVFSLASDYNFGEHRIVGTSALTAIDSFNRHQSRVQPGVVNSRPRANSVEDAVRRGQRQVEQAKIKMAMQMDDKTFQANLLESQVMLTKDQTKWNFDTLQDLIEGPLLHPKRMEEATKASRYIRKLMSFFHPFSHRFSDLAKTKINLRWVRLGCTLLNALMASPDGVRFLAEDEFLLQIVKSFAQLDPFNSTPISDPVFSKKRMHDTLTSGYFEMLGTLSKRKEGLELLEKFKLFTAFYHLSELRSREDLIKGIIENLDYSIDGHSRIVLSKALTSSYKHIRLYATNHLGTLIRGSTVANAWTLRLLLTQLYDPAMDVREVAIHFLEEACEDTEVLQTVVEMQPTLDHLGEMGHPLLLKFMSTPTGFRYLYAADYIHREMDLWFHERNLHYVVHIEVFLSRAFSFSTADDDDDVLPFDGMVPPHFYGVMAKTELGCQVLREKGHFAEFAHFIRQHGLESEDQDLIIKLKSILWAVGNVGATEGGLPFLEAEEIIPAILDIAEQSLILSVRGTCFFVLGLISSTPEGAEILDDYNWEATLSPLGLPTGICVPVDVDKFIYIPPWECVSMEDKSNNRLIPPQTEEELEVMTAIYNLANTVIANAASRSLARMKSRPEYKNIFNSSSMLYRALHTISSQRYRLPVRRYILDLFNIEFDASVVETLSQYAISLRIPPTEAIEKPPVARIVSMLGPRNGRTTESDEEDMSGGDEQQDVVKKPPAVSLRPQSRIYGFED